MLPRDNEETTSAARTDRKRTKRGKQYLRVAREGERERACEKEIERERGKESARKTERERERETERKRQRKRERKTQGEHCFSGIFPQTGVVFI